MHPLARTVAGRFSFAVPVFVMMAFALMFRHSSAKRITPATGMVAKRFRRLVPAYVAWSAIYMAARVAKHHWLASTPLQVDWPSVLFLGGASYQLYFLPAMLLWTLAIAPVWGLLQGTRRPGVVGGLLILSGMAAVAVCLQWTPPDLPFAHHLRVLSPYVLLGLGSGLVLLRTRGAPYFSAGAAILGIATATVLILAPVAQDPRFVLAIFTLANLLLLGACFLVPPTWSSQSVARIAECTFGIYLCHGLFVEGGQVLLARIGYSSPTLSMVSLFTLAVFVVSLAVTAFLGRSPQTRWLVA